MGFAHSCPSDDQYISASQQSLVDISLQIDFRYLGQVVLDRTIALRKAVYLELLKPISKWLDDPDWLKKFEKDSTTKQYNWACYKKEQRQRSKTQNYLAAERLRHYWQEVRKKKKLREEVRDILSGSKYPQLKRDDASVSSVNSFAIVGICGVFSPDQQAHRQCRAQFEQTNQYPMSMRLPWAEIIITEVTENGGHYTKFSNLYQYCHQKTRQEKIGKFMAVLDMASRNMIQISQDQPFGEILIATIDEQQGTSFVVKEPNDTECHINWRLLSPRQRQRVVDDVLDNKIILSSENGA